MLHKEMRLSYGAWLRYTLAVVLMIIALLLTLALWPKVVDSPFVFFLGAVTLSAWLGGLGPGLLATVLAIICTDYFLLDPFHVPFASPSDYVQLLVFGLVALLISWTENNRQRSEDALSQARDELTAILNGVTDGITAQTASGQILYANDAAAAHNGFNSASEMMRTPIQALHSQYNLYHPDSRPLQISELPRFTAFRTGQPSTITLRERHIETGQEKWVQLTASPIKDQNGEVSLVVNVFRDISESRAVESLREESARFLRQLLDSLPILVGVMTTDGVLREANKLALDLAGLVKDDVLGKPFDSTYWWSYSPESQDRLRAMIARAAAGESVRHDVRIRTGPDEFRTIDFMLTAMRDAEGKITHLVPAAVDVTERRAREDEIVRLTRRIRAEKRRLDTIIANIPGIVFEGQGSPENGGQDIAFISDYVETMLGYTPDEWTRNPKFFRERIHPQDLPATIERIKQIYTDCGSGTVRFRLIAKDSSIVHAESHAGVITDLHGNPIGACGVIMDITERRDIEQQLQRYMDELQRSNDELEQFAYVASHDLQEPLRKIKSYLQLVEQRYADQLDSNGKEFIDYAVDGADRMRALISDLLAYSRVQRNRGAFEPVDLNHTLANVLNILQLQIEDQAAQVTHDPLPAVHANERQMTQLFQNLLSNAIKYRREDVTPIIHISVTNQGDQWCFSVRDNGIGIDPDQRQRIFAVFQRLHHREAYSGTGIGLAICRRVVENHRGHIWVESKPGEGTTFLFTLPSDNRVKEHYNDTRKDTAG